MSDNDNLQFLNRRWSNPFRQLVQWKMSSDNIGHVTLQALKRQVQAFGNPPLWYLFANADRFDSLAVLNWEQSVQWNLEFDWLNRSFDGNKRGLDLARNTSIRRLQDLKCHTARREHRPAMTKDYLENVYVSMYEAPIEREEYPDGVRRTEVLLRLGMIRPYILDGIDYFTLQLVRHCDVNRLSLKPRCKLPVDSAYLDENIRRN